LQSMGADVVSALLAEAVTMSAVTCSRFGADPPTAAEMREACGGG